MPSPHEPSLPAPTGSPPILGAQRSRRTRWAILALLAALTAAGCASDDAAARNPDAESSSVDARQSDGASERDDGAVDAADTGATGGESPAEQAHPDVIDAAAEQSSDGTWRFDVTISSPYDSPERYADAWRVLDPDGTELGVRVLTHDHANEQPFTRSLSGVEVPDGIETVVIEGRDLANGWGGETFELDLPR
jgi:hypothetical protein